MPTPGRPLNPTARLRIATRIHFALRRHFSEDVEVRTLLDNGADTREVLWVFDASGLPELTALAAQFREACATHEKSLKPRSIGALPQDTAWSQNTSGFGLSRPTALSESPIRPTAASAAWAPMGWLRRQTWLAKR